MHHRHLLRRVAYRTDTLSLSRRTSTCSAAERPCTTTVARAAAGGQHSTTQTASQAAHSACTGPTAVGFSHQQPFFGAMLSPQHACTHQQAVNPAAGVSAPLDHSGAPENSSQLHSSSPVQAVPDACSKLRSKKRRIDSPWICPACGNRLPAGMRLVEHMGKCCNDLLVHHRQQQQQQQIGPQLQQAAANQQQQHEEQQQQQQDSASHAVSQAYGAASCWRDEQVQQLMASAAEQEHVLRMRVLRLLYVADPGGTPPVQQPAAAAAADDDDDDDLEDEDQHEDYDDSAHLSRDDEPPEAEQGYPAATAPAAAGDSSTADKAAAGGTAAAAAAGAGSQPSHTGTGRHRRRGKPVRPPLRTPQQIRDIMQLPQTRVLKLIDRAPRSIKLVADPQPLTVVYEDAHFLAVLKPPGLRSAPVHRFMGGSALNRMIGYLGYEPHLLHRLDMNTSGVLVAAKDRATACTAHAQFRDKAVSKAYLALALGVPDKAGFSVDGPIGPHPSVKVARRVVAGGLPAVTHMQVLSTNPAASLKPGTQAAEPAVSAAAAEAAGASPLPSVLQTTTSSSSSSSIAPAAVAWGCAAPDAASIGKGCSLVCCVPVTGRTHQIRVHMAHAQHPLLGDEVYGLEGPWIPRQALHAWSLTLQHPGTGQPVTFTAPPPADFAAAAAALGLELLAGGPGAWLTGNKLPPSAVQVLS